MLKTRRKLLLSFLIIVSFLTSACMLMKQENTDSIKLEVIYLGSTYYVRESSDKKLVESGDILSINNLTEARSMGDIFEVQIEPELAESWPAQAKAIGYKKASEKSSVIKEDFDFYSKLVSHTPNNVFLIDVRTKQEYESGHVPNSINIDVQDLRAKIEERVSNEGNIILLYCRSGNRSAQAAKVLQEMGYPLVFDLGGINSYTGEIHQGAQ